MSRFTPQNVAGMIEGLDGDYNDGLGAHVSVSAEGDEAAVTLTDAETGQSTSFLVKVTETISSRPL